MLADCNMETEGQLSNETCSCEMKHLQSSSHKRLLKSMILSLIKNLQVSLHKISVPSNARKLLEEDRKTVV